MEISAANAARVVHKNKETIRRWVNGNLLPYRKEGLRGDIKINIDDLRKFAQEYGYRFDEDFAAKLVG